MHLNCSRSNWIISRIADRLRAPKFSRKIFLTHRNSSINTRNEFLRQQILHWIKRSLPIPLISRSFHTNSISNKNVISWNFLSLKFGAWQRILHTVTTRRLEGLKKKQSLWKICLQLGYGKRLFYNLHLGSILN